MGKTKLEKSNIWWGKIKFCENFVNFGKNLNLAQILVFCIYQWVTFLLLMYYIGAHFNFSKQASLPKQIWVSPGCEFACKPSFDSQVSSFAKRSF